MYSSQISIYFNLVETMPFSNIQLEEVYVVVKKKNRIFEFRKPSIKRSETYTSITYWLLSSKGIELGEHGEGDFWILLCVLLG